MSIGENEWKAAVRGYVRRAFQAGVAPILGLALIALTSCGPAPVPKTVKLTVSVDDNGTVRTGASVVTFYCTESNPALGEMGLGTCKLYGEAVPVDLTQRRYLFLIFADQNSYDPDTFISDIEWSRPTNTARLWDISRDHMPRLVTFDDPDKPATVKAVQPDGLEQAFGRKMSLKSVHVELTSEPETRGQIYSFLPWLKGWDATLDGHSGKTSNNLSNQLEQDFGDRLSIA